MLVLKAVFNMLVRNASRRVSMCFRCLMFTLFHCLLDLSCGDCILVGLYFLCCSVSGSVCLMCCVFDSVCELFGETVRNMFGYGAILLLNVMEVFRVGGGALLETPCMVFQRMCVLCMCASKCSLHRFCSCRKLSPHLRV